MGDWYQNSLQRPPSLFPCREATYPHPTPGFRPPPERRLGDSLFQSHAWPPQGHGNSEPPNKCHSEPQARNPRNPTTSTPRHKATGPALARMDRFLPPLRCVRNDRRGTVRRYDTQGVVGRNGAQGRYTRVPAGGNPRTPTPPLDSGLRRKDGWGTAFFSPIRGRRKAMVIPSPRTNVIPSRRRGIQGTLQRARHATRPRDQHSPAWIDSSLRFAAFGMGGGGPCGGMTPRGSLGEMAPKGVTQRSPQAGIHVPHPAPGCRPPPERRVGDRCFQAPFAAAARPW